MAITYSPIATQTLSSTQADVTFSSIPSAYTDLILISSPLTNNSSLAVQIRFNSDTATNYSRMFMSGNGSTGSATIASNLDQNSIGYSGLNTVPYTIVTQIQNYSGTSNFKTYLSRSNSSTDEVIAYVGLWRSTSAINTIKLFPSSGGSFTSGATFTLYGIKEA